MGKGKLAKFADMAEYPHVFEYPYSQVADAPCEMKGNWNRDFFKNDHPIVLELGCGRGEYTVEPSRLMKRDWRTWRFCARTSKSSTVSSLRER